MGYKQNNEIGSLSYKYTKLIQMETRSKGKNENYKILRRKQEEKLHDIGFDNDFWYDIQSTGNRKNSYTALHQN